MGAPVTFIIYTGTIHGVENVLFKIGENRTLHAAADYGSGIWCFNTRENRFEVVQKGGYTDWAAVAIQGSGVALTAMGDYNYREVSKSEVTAKIVPQ